MAGFGKGVRVLVRPAAYPGQVWRGVIARKAKFGFIVQYEAFGVQAREAFAERELEALA